MKVLKSILKKWNSYKYRFVPWIAIKMGNQNVAIEHQEILSDEEVERQLFKLFQSLDFYSNFNCKNETVTNLTKDVGFTIETRQSCLEGAGTGVFVASGKVLPGQIVALYPGTVYFPEDPKLLQSINNPFMFRCKDYLHVDGKNWGVSKTIYKSCFSRDRLGVFDSCDSTWLSHTLSCYVSFNIGQFVNNSTFNIPANVHYQEYNIMLYNMPLNFRRFIPNINYNSYGKDFIRTVVLVATREISTDEELLSSYFTLSF